MAEYAGKKNNPYTVLLPLIVGGAVGGGLAMVFAPQVSKARNFICAAAVKAKNVVMQKRRELKPAEPEKEGDINCAVPEGADTATMSETGKS